MKMIWKINHSRFQSHPKKQGDKDANIMQASLDFKGLRGILLLVMGQRE
jgi:hypothetical protein